MVIARRITIRLAVGLLTLLAVSAVVFLGTAALPGDAAEVALVENRSPEDLAALRKEYGLDRPVLEQYGRWLAGFVTGDLGHSLPSGDPASSVIRHGVRNTLALAGLTVLVLVPLSLFLGVVSAVRQDTFLDHGIAGSTLSLIAMPEFVVGTILTLVLATWLGWLPPVSLIDGTVPISSQLTLLVLPVLTLVLASMAQTVRMIRASMIDVLQTSYVELARLKGVPERRVLFRHALPNALGATVQVIAINIAHLATGVVIVEAVFQYPGLGLALTGAVASRDTAVVLAISMLITAVYIVVNICADVFVMVHDPRLRKAHERHGLA